MPSVAVCDQIIMFVRLRGVSSAVSEIVWQCRGVVHTSCWVAAAHRSLFYSVTLCPPPAALTCFLKTPRHKQSDAMTP